VSTIDEGAPGDRRKSFTETDYTGAGAHDISSTPRWQSSSESTMTSSASPKWPTLS
jgi:hypothetical protein